MESVEAQLKMLMLAGLAGDAAAHQRLLSVAAARLRGYFRRQLGAAAPDVEDLVQESLIAIHRRRDSYDPSLPFTPWLYAIARYKLMDHYRRQGVRRQVALDDITQLAATDELEPALAASDLDRLLASLPEKHRTAIQLTRIKGYTVVEASALTGQSPSGIKIGVHRGMKRLIASVRGGRDRD